MNHLSLLEFVSLRGGTVDARTLAEHFDLESVENLVAEGLLTRDPTAPPLYRLTPQGRQLLPSRQK